MRATDLMKVAYAVSLSALLACSARDTVVAANVLSSNDTQYNSDTRTGSFGGLLDPGIPDKILHPTDPAASSTLRKAVKIRLTVTQGTLKITSEAVPVAVTFDADVLDAAGMPVLDDMQKVMRAKHSAIAQFHDRITLTSDWKDGPTMVTAEALDASGASFFSAVPATINLNKNGATAAFLDFKIPSPPPPPSSDAGTGADASDGGLDAGPDGGADTGVDLGSDSQPG